LQAAGANAALNKQVPSSLRGIPHRPA
jgi:hypothetical protein